MYLITKTANISESESITLRTHEHVGGFEDHIHDFIELVYIHSGNAVHKIDDTIYNVSHGDLLFINYGQTHSFSCDSTMKYTNILLTPEFLSNELMDTESITALFCHSMFAEFSDTPEYSTQCVSFSGNELRKVDSLIEMMHDEYEEKKQGYKSALHGCTRILFTMLLRKLTLVESNEISNVMPDIINYIDENFSEKIMLSDIAAKTFYNPVYFSRLLKEYCGKSFSAYIKEKRITKAAELLDNTNMSIESVMNSCGYTDTKLFYKHFKEIYRTPPGEYRKK